MPEHDGLCVWIAGAPGVGKSTVARALQRLFRAPLIELGELREMHLLEPDWSDAGPAEAALAFDHLVYIARSYLRADYPCVFATDLPPAELARVPDLAAAGLPSRLLTLLICDPAEHRTRLLGPRDSGFRDVERAARWNAEELARAAYPFEHRLDTTGQSPTTTAEAARRVVAAWLGDRPR
jgi:chloramphenicol 3-O-phosphotransferase